MKPWTKATQQLYWAMLLILIAGALLLLIPIWPERLLWLYAIVFWIPMIAAYVLYFLVDSWRRRDQQTETCPDDLRGMPGALRLGNTTATRIFGALALLTLVFLLVRVLIHAPASMIDYIAAAIFFVAVQFRAFLAGRNWRYAKYKRLSRANRKSGKQKKN